MKKALQLLRVAMLFGSGILASACAKESENVSPKLQIVRSSNLYIPGTLNPVKIGETWPQGPDATNLGCDVTMTLLTHKITPKGEIDTWAGTIPASSCRPTTKHMSNKSFTLVIDGESYTYQIHTVAETNGNVSMRTNWNLSTDRSDDL
ncbi:hypothetical protein [Hymenobacter sp. HDW8]|uniref:hypothetical protein n=1 Tax=Hymenobacter sp. HDW8 TaxID=2714932 RepID=UPI00140A6EFD|nr:hypothetical protein [Hymenobacter sp. HDW8]QIL77242.1 hypothetical protein G7064_16365 [Hymenobacter sp. HDW8]